MANRYWVGGTANWDGTAGTKWALTSGGAGGEAVPTSSDDVFFDANSGTVTVTKTTNDSCLSLNFTGFTGTFAGASTFAVAGSFILNPSMTFSFTGGLVFNASTTGRIITMAGHTYKPSSIAFGMTLGGAGVAGGGWTLQDNLTCTDSDCEFDIVGGALNTNGKTVTTGFVYTSSGSTVRSLTLGSSTIILKSSQGWQVPAGSNFTLNANTSTLKFTDSSNSSCTFQGQGLTYNNVWFDRGASTGTITITGANTFNEFKDTGTAAHAITFPNVTTTVSSFDVSGSAGNLITLQRTGGSGTWTISDTSGTNTCEYVSISNSTATGGATFNAFIEDGSTDGGGNTGWNFYDVPDVETDSVTNILINTATGNGDITDDRGTAITERGIVLSTSPNPTTSNTKFTTSGTTGSFSVSLTGLTGNVTYYVRAYAINTGGTGYGEDETFDTLNWTNVSKPTTENWTEVNAQGREQYDQADVMYDDPDVFYDGVNPSQWSDISKPVISAWTDVPKPN